MAKMSVWTVGCLVAILAFAGCAKKGLDGKWTGSITNSGVTVNITMTLNKDGNFTQDSVLQGGPIPTAMVATGTWTEKDGKLSLKPVSLKVNDKTMPVSGDMSKDVKYKLEGDTLTLEDISSTPVVLNRAK